MEHDPVWDGAWEISCKRDIFLRIQSTPTLRTVLVLGRIVNALRFAGYALKHVDGSDDPAAIRGRLNSLMYTGAILHEAEDFVRRCGSDLREFPSHIALEAWRASPNQDFLQKELKPLRNRTVFHYDPHFLPENLAVADQDKIVAVTGKGARSGESYIYLADQAAMEAVIGGTPGTPEHTERTGRFIMRTTKIMLSFLDAADAVIVDALASPEWTVAPAQSA